MGLAHSLLLGKGKVVLTERRIREIIAPALTDEAVALLDVMVRGVSGRLQLAITLDHKERAITLDECATCSRAFEDRLDLADDVPREYALDVSSPGLDRPLSEAWQYTKNVGRAIKVVIRDPELDSQLEEPAPKRSKKEGKGKKKKKKLQIPPGHRLVEGELKAVQEDGVVVDEGELIPWGRITEARVALPW